MYLRDQLGGTIGAENMGLNRLSEHSVNLVVTPSAPQQWRVRVSIVLTLQWPLQHHSSDVSEWAYMTPLCVLTLQWHPQHHSSDMSEWTYMTLLCVLTLQWHPQQHNSDVTLITGRPVSHSLTRGLNINASPLGQHRYTDTNRIPALFYRFDNHM